VKVFVYRKLYPRCSRQEVCPLRTPFYEIPSRNARELCRLLRFGVCDSWRHVCTICGHDGEAEVDFEFIRLRLFSSTYRHVRAAQVVRAKNARDVLQELVT